ncbi:hypothetical protein U1Q18_001880 [Sarracenia purpurea var. burkii]
MQATTDGEWEGAVRASSGERGSARICSQTLSQDDCGNRRSVGVLVCQMVLSELAAEWTSSRRVLLVAQIRSLLGVDRARLGLCRLLNALHIFLNILTLVLVLEPVGLVLYNFLILGPIRFRHGPVRFSPSPLLQNT